jgi:hypothetical protein
MTTRREGEKGDLAARLFERYFCTPGWGICSGTPREITTTTPQTAPYFLTLSLPAGKYAVTAEVVVVAHSEDPESNPSDWRIACVARAVTTAGWAGQAAATVGDLTGNTNEATLSITGGLIAAAPDDIGIRCWRTGESGSLGTGPNPRIMYGVIDAVEVGSITSSEQT